MIKQLMNSPTLMCLSVALFFSYCITTFDKRLVQARRAGMLPPNSPMLPDWVGVFHILDWVILIAMLILNWKVGLFVWAVLFALKVLPVLETIGNVMMAPFKPKSPRD